MNRTDAYYDMLLRGNTRAIGDASPKRSIYERFSGPVRPLGLFVPARNDELYLWFARAVKTCPPEVCTPAAKHARFETMLLDHLRLDVNELELFAGRRCGSFQPDEAEAEDIRWGKENWDRLMDEGWESNATGHRAGDWDKLLTLGLGGILREIDERSAAFAPDAPEQGFYASVRESVSAVIRFAERYRLFLLEKAEKTPEPRRSELLTMADILSRVPFGPVKTFREALQSVWLTQFCCCVVGDMLVTGRFDRLFYPYYRADVDAGRLDREEALELIEQYYFKNDELYGVFPASILLCGVDPDGNPVLNDLSYLCVEAIGTTKLINPSVAVAWRPDLPEDFLRPCVREIAEGYTRPSFFNDALIQEGLRDAGLSERDARSWCHSTCVEITPVGCSNVYVTTPYLNLNKVLEYVLSEGGCLFGKPCRMDRDLSVSLDALDTFDAFRDQLFVCIRENIRAAVTDVVELLDLRAKNNASPLVSAFTNDCLARGKDCGSGGGRYTMDYPCFPGFINLIDSLAAIRKAVYEDKKYTLRELADACRENFPDERMRQYLLNVCPKFGNDLPETDALGTELFDLIRDELKKYHTALGGTFHPSYFAWIMHGVLGAKGSALPDGRKQGDALSEHLGAAQGRDKAGPLAVIRSIARLPQKYGIGGIATNFRFSRSFASSPEGTDAIIALIRYFMEEGGFEAQFNVVSQEELIAAKEHPEDYKTLLVRVAGYNDYFINLDPVIQDEIIRRREHDEI